MADRLGRLVEWRPVQPPERTVIPGQRVSLVPLDPERHGSGLFDAAQGSGSDPALWDYLPYGPFESESAFRRWLQECAAASDPLFFSVVNRVTDTAEGMVSYLRIVAVHGVIEIGHIWFGQALQRTARATEAIYLLLHSAFDDLGYRRVEWKCDSLNQRSRRAAERFGFAPEGLFRQHSVVKGRNRDTAWFAMLDHEWPRNRAAFERWLSPGNFDSLGRQRASLAALREQQ